MDIRFCHPSDFSEFLKLQDPATCKFGGFFGDYINAVMLPFLKNFNMTAIMDRGDGFGELIDKNGSYNGCLGRLQRNESDVLFRFADYPSPVANISQGDIFLDTRLVMCQVYLIPTADRKFQILSTLKSFWHVFPYIALFFMSLIIVFQVANRIIFKRKCITVHLTFGRPIKLFMYDDRNILNMFAHAFRFGSIRAKRLHTRPVFISLSIFSLILIHIFFSSIKTDLVVVTEPEHWDSYEDIMKAKVLPIFVREMGTAQYFKLAPTGSLEKRLWEYVQTNYNESMAIIPAAISSFFGAGMLVQSRRGILLTDHIMGVVVQNAVCGLNKYDYAGFANSALPKPFAWSNSLHYFINADELSQTIQKGVVYNYMFQSRAERIFKRFVKYSHESGITERNIKAVTTANMMESFVENLPRSGRDSSSVTECKSETIVKPQGKNEKLVTFGNTVTLQMCYLILNIIALIILVMEKIFPGQKAKPARRRRRRNWFHESSSAVYSSRSRLMHLYP